MRFERIEVERFGPFTELTLDFTGLVNGLHLVHGPNEAGKSSFLRAVSALLFGYEQSGENWKHDYKDFRLSAVLADGRGGSLAFTRLKRNKGGLRSPADEPIDEGRLHRFLGGLDRPTYEAVFSLDCDRLRRGGKEIADGAGDLGKLLFAASGLGTVAGLTAWLEDQYKRLYLPTGKLPAVNERINEIRQLRVQERELALSVEEYAHCEAAKRDSDEQLARRRDAAAELERERRRLEAILGAKDDVLRREQLLQTRQELAPAPELPEGVALEAVKAEAVVRSKQVEFSRLQERIAAREAELAALQLDEPIFEAADAVERLLRKIDLHTANREKAAEAADRRGASEREAAALREQLADVPAAHEWEAIAARLQALGGIGADALDLARRDATAKQAAVDGLLRRLAGWRGDLESLVSSPMPTRKEVEEWDEEFRRRLRERDTAQARLQELRRELEQRERLIAGPAGPPQVPTQEQLEEARARRDRGLDLVDAKLKKRPDAVGEAAFLEEAGAASLMDGVRRAVQQGDAAADALRADAETAATQKEVRLQCERLRREIGRQDEDLLELETVQEARQWAWRRRWEGLPLEVKSPAVMLQWLDDRRTLLEKWQEQRDASERAALLERQFEDRRREAGRLLDRLGMVAEEDEPLPASVERARRRLKDLERAHAKLQRLEETLEEDERSLRKLNDEEAALLAEARRLAAKLTIDTAETELQRIADEFRPRLRKAKSVEARRDQLTKDLDEAREQLEEVARERNEAQSRLEGPMRMAGVQTLPALAEADARSRRKKEVAVELVQVEARIRKAAGDRPLDAFAAEVAAASGDDLADRLAKLQDDLAAAVRERDEWIDRAGRARDELAAMQRRGAEAAEARQQAEYALGHALERARRYAVLRSAQALLEAAVRDYRERNETKVLHRARELFRRLTNGAYATLRSDVEGGKDAKLLAVRGDEEVSVASLSEGTRDQLYLALRLAALEAMFDQRGPVPVLADDLLMTFDDGRTVSALAVLADFARKSQVLLLTHHEHVVEAARVTLKKGEFRVHELAASDSIPEFRLANPPETVSRKLRDGA